MAERDRKRESIVRVFKVCKLTDELTEEDFRHVDEMIIEQREFMHPLKGGTQQYYNKLGAANQVILDKVRELRAAIQVLKGIPQ